MECGGGSHRFLVAFYRNRDFRKAATDRRRTPQSRMECGGGSHRFLVGFFRNRDFRKAATDRRRTPKSRMECGGEATAFWSGSSGIAMLGKRRLIVAALQKSYGVRWRSHRFLVGFYRNRDVRKAATDRRRTPKGRMECGGGSHRFLVRFFRNRDVRKAATNRRRTPKSRMECGGGSHRFLVGFYRNRDVRKAATDRRRTPKVVWSAVAEATAFWSGSTGIAMLGKRRLIVAALQKVTRVSRPS
jgi:hypothetical protein